MKSSWRIGVAAAVALAFIGVPTKSEALVITSVTVSLGATNVSDIGWTFPRTLSAGQDMVLTADTGPSGPLNGNSFDISDKDSLTNATITIVTDTGTFTYTDTNGVLTLKGQDPAAHPLDFFEGQPYTTLTGGSPGFTVQVGYADTEHTGGCDATSVASISGLTCNSSSGVPSPFGSATIFQGLGAATGTGFNCAGTDASKCWDAGVIRISVPAVPEPATMMLLGTGLVGLAARRRMKAKGR